MKVGYIQFGPVLGAPERNRSRLDDLLKTVDVDMVVLPELSNSGYNFSSMDEVLQVAESAEDGPTVSFWRQTAVDQNMAIVGGVAERVNDTCYNSAVAIDKDGSIALVYRKLHLFGQEPMWFYTGDRLPPVIELAGAKVGVLICFDWAFPEASRVLALRGGEVLCHPANIVTSFPPQGMLVRGVENRVFTITANRVGSEDGAAGNLRFPGLSQVTTPDGEILSRAGEDGEEAAEVEITLSKARDKRLGGFTDLFQSRCPEQYETLVSGA